MQETTEKTSRPVRIISTPGQIDADTQQKIGNEVEKLNYPPETTIPPAEQKPPYKEGVEGIGGETVGEFLDVTGSLGTAAVEKVTGKEMHSDTRSTPGGKFHWLVEAYRRIKSKVRGE